MEDAKIKMKGAFGISLPTIGAWRRWQWVFGYFMTVFLGTVGIHWLWRNWNVLTRLATVNPSWTVIVFLMLAISLCAQSLFLKVLVKEIGGNIGARECFCLVTATNMMSQLIPPPAGAAYRAFYLQSRHGVNMLPFASGTALFMVVSVLLWCVAGVVAMFAGGVFSREAHSPLLVVAIVAACMLIIASQARGLASIFSFHGSYQRVASSAVRLQGGLSRRVGSVAGATILLSMPAQVLGFFAILRIFGLSVNLGESAIVLAFQQISGVIGLTPGGVGVQEGVGGIVASELKLDVAEIVSVLALIRVARIILSIVSGGTCLWLLKSEENKTARHSRS